MKLFRLKYITLKQSGILFALAFFILAYGAVFFGMAYAYHAVDTKAAVEAGRVLTEECLDILKMVSSSSVIGISFLLFAVPILSMKSNKDMGSTKYIELAMSLPVTRSRFALSQVVFQEAASLLLILLFALVTWIGLLKGSFPKETGEIFLKALIALLTVEINLAGAVATALCFGAKRPGLVAAVFFGLLFLFLLKVPSGLLYDFTAAGFFWPVLAGTALPANLLCGSIAVRVFERKDI